MKLNEIRPARGAVKKRKRIGRGTGSGHGGTATKGHKGQQARSGTPKGKGFEGGQMPLTRRIPKFGFKNPNRVRFQPINVGLLDKRYADGDTVDAASLIEHGLLSKRNDPIKILGNGALSKRLSIRVDAVSGTARKKIEAAGGDVQLTSKPSRKAGATEAAAGAGE